MFVLRSSISVQVGKKRFEIVNKQDGLNKHWGGGGELEKNPKLINWGRENLFGTQE